MSWVIALFPLFIAGCIHADCEDNLPVRGRLVDAESGGAVAGAIVGGRSFTDGVETDDLAPLGINGTPQHLVSEANGSFVLVFNSVFGGCPPPIILRPDHLEIIVLRDGCEQRFMIEINEDTAQFVDGEFSINELVLTNPILVPPCAQPP